MEQALTEPGFSLWLSATHYLNLLFLTLLVRSGIQILYDFPRLFWSDHCVPDTEWLRFTPLKVPKDCLWTSLDDARPVSTWIALPGGRHSLGVGRHWHFFIAFLWIINGLIYVSHLFLSDGWRRLIPTSWDFFPQVWSVFLAYASFHLPPASAFHPYDPLQMLAYTAVVFLLSPFMILTGLAMFPAISGHFPWYIKLFGGRQRARSLHFMGLVAFLVFVVIHVTLVVVTGFGANAVHIVLGRMEGSHSLAITLFFVGLFVIFLVNVGVTIWSKKVPRQVQDSIGHWIHEVALFFFSRCTSRQQYSRDAISPYFWVNGYPPTDQEWVNGTREGFVNYRLKIGGAIQNPISLSLEQIQALPKVSQTTLHCCIQGWSGIATWAGVPLGEIIDLVKPLPEARYIVFHSFQMNPAEVGDRNQKVEYYGSLNLEEARFPQTILSYEMNGEPLPLVHGAPLRLRVESQLGFKMVKWIKSIEFVADLSSVGLGRGGFREDQQFYDRNAQI